MHRALPLLILLAAHASACAGADSHDERFLAGLRERGLTRLIEKYCQARLNDSELPPARRATLTIELARAYAAQAAAAPVAEQDALWRKARQVLDEFAARHPRDPRLLLVRMQGTLVAIWQGELARQNAELSAAPGDLEKARGLLRGAIVELRAVDEAIGRELPRRGAAGRDDDESLSADELASLQLHARHQLARALRNQGLCYPPAGADRINSLGQSVELLKGLSQHELTVDLAWDVRLDLLACLRSLGSYDDAERKLAEAAKSQPPASIVPRLQAERMRLALTRGRIDEAVSQAGPASAKTGTDHIEEDLARLEAYLAAWRRAQQSRDSAGSAKWEQAAVAQARAIGQAHPAATARRAETMLARSIVQSGGGEGPRATLLAAQSLYRAGRLDEALAAFDKAAHRAAAIENSSATFDAHYSAAALEQERGNHAEALSRFRKLALAMPANPRAAAAHLLAIHSAAQVARQQSTPQLDEYGQLLREHVARWPDAKTAPQAWCWLGRLAEHQRAWQVAIAALAHVAPSDPQYAEAVEATGRCYLAALAEMRSRGNANDLLARDAVAYFQKVIGPAGSTYTAASRAAVLALARIYLTEMSGAAAKADELLKPAMAASNDAPVAWCSAAGMLHAAALAAGGDIAAAQQALTQHPPDSAADALALIEILQTVQDRAPRADKKKLAEVELAVIANLASKQPDLDDAARKQLASRRVETLIELDRQSEALDELRALAEKYSRDGPLQEKFADLLAASPDRENREAAVARWRDVAAHCRPGSQRWYRAQFALARLQLDLGDSTQARATIKRVEATHPGLGGDELKARFLQLLAECEREISNGPKK